MFSIHIEPDEWDKIMKKYLGLLLFVAVWGCSSVLAADLVPSLPSFCDAAKTKAFVGQVPNARNVDLPKVGHGFGVFKNWLPQLMSPPSRSKGLIILRGTISRSGVTSSAC